MSQARPGRRGVRGSTAVTGESREQSLLPGVPTGNILEMGRSSYALRPWGCGSGDRGGRASRRGPGACKVPSTQGILSHALAPVWRPVPARQFHNRVSFLLVPSGVYASSVQDMGTQNEASEQGGGPDTGPDMASFHLGPGLSPPAMRSPGVFPYESDQNISAGC